MIASLAKDLAQALAAVDDAACDSYRDQATYLIAYVNWNMAERADIGDLLGPCPPAMLNRSHGDHARFMEAQLRLQSADSLIAMFTWVYQTHLRRGVALRTFPIDLSLWIEAIQLYLDATAADQIAAVYQCLCDLHSQLVLRTYTPQAQPAIAPDLRPSYQAYLQALLKPDTSAAIRVAGASIKSAQDVTAWWEGVIRPAQYTIGDMWARGEISVAQEHLATAITQRVMALYSPLILGQPRQKGPVIVAASPGELHDIGGRIMSDLLELSGWDAYYTGANTPAQSLVDLAGQQQARALCISTTLATSLPAVMALIAQVRAADLQPAPHILVGGQAYMADAAIWKRVGADWFALSARAGVEYVERVAAA